MSDNLKTIRELAEELGVSKTAINKKVSDKERKQWFSKNGNRFLINENGQKAIKAMFLNDIDNRKLETENTERQPESTTENFGSNGQNNVDINYVRDIINYQNAQIEDLKETKAQQFKQLNQMQNLLDQQQRLALQDKKLLEEYKEEIKDLKSLNTPTKDSEKNDSTQKETSVENIKEAPHKKNKKWWNFGK
ncbi:DNA-binding protein [Leuconostoc gelidum subsp. gasicomitatum]|uniref:DNA-binding protein n=1 Tax=Leuconostoc gasicomitatum TaxID=115778 RepID=UPI001CCAE0C2|nr:DNA-binding protein [Leuconostoc gasicomitatum]MBZ5972749.1 DNA-binding protein [Leuconostoc gasicomitatum]